MNFKIFVLLFFVSVLNLGGQTIKTNPQDGLRYVKIPSGNFLMGCIGDKDCWEEEKPQHKVKITRGFWLSQTETTVGAFRKFIKDSDYIPSSIKENKGRMYLNELDDWQWTSGLTWETPIVPTFKAEENFPVAQVSWDDANAFCRWAGGRLPTEAEWEYASRGGLVNNLYPWGNEILPIKNGIKQSNVPDEQTAELFPKMKVFNGYDDGFATFAPVGSFAANGFGLFDMSGNVWEWTNDWFAEKQYKNRVETNPQGAKKGKSKIVRGGAWCYSPEQHRSSERGVFEYEKFWTASLGFRCVIRKL